MKVITLICLCVRYILTAAIIGLLFLLCCVCAHQMLKGNPFWLIPLFVSTAALLGCIMKKCGKIGKAIGEKTISLTLKEIDENNADSGEIALGFMKPEELDSPEDDSAEILVKIVVKRIGE